MDTKPNMEPSGSPVPGVIPETPHVHQDPAPADDGRSPEPDGRRDLVRLGIARLRRALRAKER